MSEVILALSSLVTAISGFIAVLKGRESSRRGNIIAAAQKDPYIRLKLERMLADGILDKSELEELKRLLE